MRELKFRAWDAEGTIKGQKWYYFGGIFNEQPWVETSTFAQYESYPKKIPVVVMQYTGLKDKNGKEIYEGDIVDFGRTYSSPRVEVVEWLEGAAGFSPFDDADEAEGLAVYPEAHQCEVIGNIYEHPELVKGKA